jgi:hypothetical protein
VFAPFLWLTAAQASCELPRTIPELETALVGTEQAWGSDPAAFADSAAATAAILACLDHPVAGPLAARLLRMEGLRSFVRRDLDAAGRAFAAARAVDPAITIPADWAPEGNPVRGLWDGASAPSTTVTLRPARRGDVWVDGDAVTAVPSGRPFVFQWIDGHDTSGAIATAAAIPRYPKKAVAARDPLLVTGSIAGVASGVLLALAWQARGDFDEAADLATLDEAKARTNTLTLAWAGTGGVAALALGAGLVVAAF